MPRLLAAANRQESSPSSGTDTCTAVTNEITSGYRCRLLRNILIEAHIYQSLHPSSFILPCIPLPPGCALRDVTTSTFSRSPLSLERSPKQRKVPRTCRPTASKLAHDYSLFSHLQPSTRLDSPPPPSSTSLPWSDVNTAAPPVLLVLQASLALDHHNIAAPRQLLYLYIPRAACQQLSTSSSGVPSCLASISRLITVNILPGEHILPALPKTTIPPSRRAPTHLSAMQKHMY